MSKCDCGGVYPYYGLAPHKHVFIPDDPRTLIGSTVVGKKPYPLNFREDPDAEGCGVYLYCLKCGEGEK